MRNVLLVLALTGCGIAPRVVPKSGPHLYVRNTNEDLGRLVEGSKAYSIRFNAVIDFANPVELYMEESSLDCRLADSVIMLGRNRMDENAFISPTGLVLRVSGKEDMVSIAAVQSYDWSAQQTNCETFGAPVTVKAYHYLWIMEAGDMARVPIYAAEDLEVR